MQSNTNNLCANVVLNQTLVFAGATSTSTVESAQGNDSNQPIDLRSSTILVQSCGSTEVIDLCSPPNNVINLSTPEPVAGSTTRGLSSCQSESGLSDSTFIYTSEDVCKCPVCLRSVRLNKPYATLCGHVFCKTCILSAIQSSRKCPLCNKNLFRRLRRIYF